MHSHPLRLVPGCCPLVFGLFGIVGAAGKGRTERTDFDDATMGLVVM